MAMLHGGEDGRWAEDWSEDVERTYDAPPPLDLTEFDLALYRRLKRHDSRAGSIPSQKLLAAELGVSVPTIKRSIRRLRYAGWLEISQRPQRNARRGGQLRGGNRYHPKQSLNDLDEEVLPAGGNEGSRHLCWSQRGITVQGGKAPGRYEGSRQSEIPRRG